MQHELQTADGHWKNRLVHGLVMVCGFAAVTGLLAVSVMMNMRFGQALGRTPLDGWVFATASASADVLKALTPFLVALAWRNSRYVVVLAGIVLWFVFTGYSLTSSLGFSALNRSEVTYQRQLQGDTVATLRGELTRVRGRLANAPKEAVAELNAALSAKRQHRRWDATSGCTDATAGKSRTFCEEYDTLRGRQAAVRARVKDEGRLVKLQERLEQLREEGGTVGPGPQTGLLKGLLGRIVGNLESSSVEQGLIVMLALLVELGSGLGFFVLFGHGGFGSGSSRPAAQASPGRSGARPSRSVTAAPVQVPHIEAPAPEEASPSMGVSGSPNHEADESAADEHETVPLAAQWIRDRVEKDEGASLLVTVAFEDFCAWCERTGAADMALRGFSSWLKSQGLETALIAGRNRLVGVALRDERASGTHDREFAEMLESHVLEGSRTD